MPSLGRLHRPSNRIAFTAVCSILWFTLAAAASDCISLASSSSCSAFGDAQVSTSSALQSNFPFLAFVANTDQFDEQFQQYLQADYVKFKYGNLFGCTNLTLSNTTNLYARYTETVLCSEMVQQSTSECGSSDNATRPVCADTCAQFAQSEQIIVANMGTCGNSSSDATDLIRSDFTVCSLPSKSLDNTCVEGDANEGNANCGFMQNLPGMCLYCSESSANSTDTCCYNANATTVCQNVTLPSITALSSVVTETATTTSTATPGHSASSSLSGGAIAGITIGSIAAVALVALGLLLCWRHRRARHTQATVFNQPNRQSHRGTQSMAFNPVAAASNNNGHGYEVLAGGRVARMSALENASMQDLSSPPPVPAYSQHNMRNLSATEVGFEDSPDSDDLRRSSPQHRPLNPPPGARNASLSSASMMLSGDPASPESEKNTSSPDYGSPQSEQLPYFKDYYSSDEIHPGDKVATLWAYQPRASDEFELERGDMLKVVGIWDDGWATGIRLSERAEDYIQRRELRDSGVSASQASQRRQSSPPPIGEIKAFPLVCVCLPDHWHKTIESDDIQGSDFGSPDNSDPVENPTHVEDSDRESRGIPAKSSSRFKEDLGVTGS